MVKGFKDEEGKFHPTEKNNNKVSKEDVKGESAEKLIDKNKADEIKSLKVIKENAKEHNLELSIVVKLQELEGDNVLVEDVEQGGSGFGNGDLIKLDNGAEYLLFESRDKLEQEAKDAVRQDLEENPEIFNEGFIQDHLSISDTDARLSAQDLAQSRLEGVEDELSSEIEDEVRDELSDKEDDDNFEELVDDEVQKRLPKALEEKESEIVDELEEKIKSDPVGFFVDEEGIFSREDLLKQSFMQLDIDSAVDDAVSEDGAEHFISRVDGDSHEVDGEQVLVKEND